MQMILPVSNIFQHEQMRWEQQLRFREEELRRWEHEEFMRRSSEVIMSNTLPCFVGEVLVEVFQFNIKVQLNTKATEKDT